MISDPEMPFIDGKYRVETNRAERKAAHAARIRRYRRRKKQMLNGVPNTSQPEISLPSTSQSSAMESATASDEPEDQYLDRASDDSESSKFSAHESSADESTEWSQPPLSIEAELGAVFSRNNVTRECGSQILDVLRRYGHPLLPKDPRSLPVLCHTGSFQIEESNVTYIGIGRCLQYITNKFYNNQLLR